LHQPSKNWDSRFVRPERCDTNRVNGAGVHGGDGGGDAVDENGGSYGVDDPLTSSPDEATGNQIAVAVVGASRGESSCSDRDVGRIRDAVTGKQSGIAEDDLLRHLL
jgi:hypothetical protein